jgi:hypothetical protein
MWRGLRLRGEVEGWVTAELVVGKRRVPVPDAWDLPALQDCEL